MDEEENIPGMDPPKDGTKGEEGRVSPRKKTKMEPADAFARQTKRVLTRGTTEDMGAWLLAYPIFSTSTSSPARELFRLCEHRYRFRSFSQVPVRWTRRADNGDGLGSILNADMPR